MSECGAWLARSAEHRNYQAIEWELRASGYPQARQLLDRERVRERLDGMCAVAQRIRKCPEVPDRGSFLIPGRLSGRPLPIRDFGCVLKLIGSLT